MNELAHGTLAFVLRPRAFFVAWSGVLTLVFEGWPPPAARFKASLRAAHGACLPAEDPGSRFPKVTLAALRASRTPLELDELERLLALCTELAPLVHAVPAVPVSALSWTLWACGSHERLVARADMVLGAPTDEAHADDEHASYVQSVLAEATDVRAYLPSVRKPGSIERYRELRLTPGASVVAFVGRGGVSHQDDGSVAHAHLWRVLAEFRRRVEAAVPGVYEWIDEHALHCTLLALAPAAPFQAASAVGVLAAD